MSKRTQLILILTGVVGALAFVASGCQKNAPPKEQSRTASGILVHYPSGVRTPESWKGHNFSVNGVPVQPSEKVPESELLKCVGKRVSVTGQWNPGTVWKPTEEERKTQMPVYPDSDEPIIRGDGIRLETMQELKDN